MKPTLPLKIHALFLQLDEAAYAHPVDSNLCLALDRPIPNHTPSLPLGLVLAAGMMPAATEEDRAVLTHALSRYFRTCLSRPQAEALHWLGHRLYDLAAIQQHNLTGTVYADGDILLHPGLGPNSDIVYARAGKWHGDTLQGSWHAPDLPTVFQRYSL
jgi:hypothetical protein